LQAACARVGFDAAGAEPIKFTNNAVFALASAPVVIRIAGSAAVRRRVPKIIAVAGWLAHHGLPAVRLVDELPQPLQVDGQSVTFWHRVVAPPSAPVPDGCDLGRILREYHALPLPTFELPRWQPITSIRQRIEEEDVLTGTEHRYLVDQCDDVENALHAVEYRLPPGPIHGDAFVGNLIAGPDGPVICDFDSAAIGPREWDLTPVAVGKLRFAYPVDYHRQVAGDYGVDILHWEHFPVLRRLRELQLVTSVLPVLGTNCSLVDQWRYRFTSFRAGDLSAAWTPYR
jgi:hypothetical protein